MQLLASNGKPANFLLQNPLSLSALTESSMTYPGKILLSLFLLSPFAFFLSPSTYSQPMKTMTLWPASVPSETRSKAADLVSPDHGGNVIRIASVTDPAIDVFEPDGGNRNGVGIIICPGGGYQILAYDLEGTEVAEWLNSLGITAFLLHYRVPDNRTGALQDAQRAIRVVRSLSADKYPYLKTIGIMGFSAGGSLSARASTRYQDKTYEPVDQADQLSARPDFALLIYPAYLDQGPNNSLTPELKVDSQTPPMFLFQTADDGLCNSSLVMTQALREAKVPVELHILPEGGHGYGLRKGNQAAETWPELAGNWLQQFRKSDK
jgi:acetyl esterase/lipase